MPMIKMKTAKNVCIYFCLIVFALVCLFPFYWMLLTALKTPASAIEFPPKLYPTSFQVSNFTKIFELLPMGKAYLNSLKVTILTTVGTLFTSSLAAYAFSKLYFKGKGILFGLLIATMMIPVQVTLIPLYIFLSKIGWVDSHLPLWVPLSLTNAYGVFLIRQYMLTIPSDYIEAAKIDGCTFFRTYREVMLPLSKPIIVTLGLFTFIYSWNDYFKPLIFLINEDKFTVPLIVAAFRGVYMVQWEMLMAASAVAVLPIIVFFFLSQRYFIESISLAGIKG